MNFNKPSTLFETCKCCGVTSKKMRYFLVQAISHKYHGMKMFEEFDIDFLSKPSKAWEQLKEDFKKYEFTDEEQMFVITKQD